MRRPTPTLWVSMPVFRRHHGVIALLGLTAYLVAAFGFLPSPAFVRDALNLVGADRFPCESHACGCMDAESCLSDCCCYSPSEVRAWAESNNLDPVAWTRLDSLLADASADADDDCSMCSLTEPNEPNEPESIDLPAVSALECQQVGQWLLIATPIASKPTPVSAIDAMKPPQSQRRMVSWPLPERRTLDIPAPPPRSA